MELFITLCIIFALIILLVPLFRKFVAKNASRLEEEEMAKREALKAAEAKKQEIKEKKLEVLRAREREYGPLTRKISSPLNSGSIFVYEEGQVIIIDDVVYPFSKIKGAVLDKQVRPGKEKIITEEIPLTYEEQLERACGNRNVFQRQTKLVTKSPDVTTYVVIVQLFDLKTPTLSFRFFIMSDAYDFKTLIDNIVLFGQEKQ